MDGVLLLKFLLQLFLIGIELFFISFFYRIYKDYPTISKWKIGIIGVCLLVGYSTIQFLQDWTTLTREFYQDYHVSISGGTATYPDDGVRLNELAEIADKRMYQRKAMVKQPYI